MNYPKLRRHLVWCIKLYVDTRPKTPINTIKHEEVNCLTTFFIQLELWGVVAVIVWKLDLQLPMQSVPITTDVVSSNLDQREVYNIIDKVCQWLATGRWFSPCPPVSSTNKTDLHDTTGILLKVALNTTKQTNNTLIRNGWPMVSRSKSHNSRLHRGLNECLVFVDWCQVPCT
jgi:hypothetical protein